MDKIVIVAVVSYPDEVDTIINNLSEEGFDPNNISVVLQNEEENQIYANEFGPITNANAENVINKLIHVGISADIADNFQRALKHGSAILAIGVDNAEEEEAVQELLEDYNIEDIEVSE